MDKNLVLLKDNSLQQISALEEQTAVKQQSFHDMEMSYNSEAAKCTAQQQALDDCARQLVAMEATVADSRHASSHSAVQLEESRKALIVADSKLEAYAARTQQEYTKMMGKHDEDLKAAQVKVDELSDALQSSQQHHTEQRQMAEAASAAQQQRIDSNTQTASKLRNGKRGYNATADSSTQLAKPKPGTSTYSRKPRGSILADMSAQGSDQSPAETSAQKAKYAQEQDVTLNGFKSHMEYLNKRRCFGSIGELFSGYG
ncbi:hypothetical protein WJX73_010163 [Symbiochloris irregularis]|uniref:Myosin heavy chain n=1 Tax=Symbiochloris irregularis TaxID=706552 RepID=A0AAW1PIY1_9CHLO